MRACMRPAPLSVPSLAGVVLRRRLAELEQVAEPALLRAQVADVLEGRLGRQRDALDDLEAEAGEACVLGRVVRHQPHLADAEVAEDLRADAVAAGVGREAELEIRLDGVE